MTRVRQRVTVHEKTIQKAAREALPQPKKQRAPKQVQPTHGAPLVHEQVWAEVQKILAGKHGYTRWEIKSETEMVVR